MELPRIGPQLPKISLEECKIVIVGEAPGKDEIPVGYPFVGRAGRLLDDILNDAGIVRDECYITNVFMIRPPDNKVAHFFVSPTSAHKNNIGCCRDLPMFSGMYLRTEFFGEIARLTEEIEKLNPRVIITLGNTPLWAFTGLGGGITQVHGKPYESVLVPTATIVPTYHPAYILRNNEERPEMVKDLILAKRFI